jgi:linoleoyl-CoA desaturase
MTSIQNVKSEVRTESNPFDGFYRSLRTEVYADIRARHGHLNATSEGWLKFFFSLGTILLTYFALMTQPIEGALQGFLLCTLLSVSIMYLKVNCLHDFMHGSFSRNPRVNGAFSYVIDVLGPSSFIWKNKHNHSHHRHTNHGDLDNDISFSSVLRFSPERKYYPVHRAQKYYATLAYCIQSFFWFFFTDFKNLIRRNVSGIPLVGLSGKEVFIFLLMKATHLTLAIILPAQVFGLEGALLGYGYVYGLSGLFLALLFVSAHIFEGSKFHSIEKFRSGDEWAVAQIEGTSVFSVGSRFANFAYGGLHLQVVHHLFPDVSNEHYPDIWPLIQKRARERGIAVQEFPSFFAVIRSHYRFLGKLGLVAGSLLIASFSWAHSPATLSELNQRQGELSEKYFQIKSQYSDPYALLQDLEVGRKGIEEFKAFFAAYDDFNNQKIQVFTDALFQRLKLEATLVPVKGVSEKKQRKFEALLNDAEAAYFDAQKKRTLFRTPEDYKRVSAFRRFYAKAGMLINAWVESEGRVPSRRFKPTLLPFLNSLKEFLPVADDFLKLLGVLYFRKNGGDQGEAPIIEALKDSQRALMASKKTKVTWDGLQYLENNPYDGKSLQLFFMNHGNSYLDTSAQVSFPVNDVSSIGNVSVIFPNFIGNPMRKSNHMVTVGDADPIEKLDRIVKGRRLNRFMVATEGLTPVGFYEMRPMLMNVAPALKAMVAKGMEATIYPMSFPDHLRFMNQTEFALEGDNHQARGVLHEPIRQTQWLALNRASNDDEAINHLVRWIWFSDLPNNADVFLGMPSPTKISELMEKFFWADFSQLHVDSIFKDE